MERKPGLTKKQITERLRLHYNDRYKQSNLKDHSIFRRLSPSAVLTPLLIRDGQVRVLLTKRSSNLKNHAGEVCFPGGRMETGDVTEEDTCLREAEEEIGLKREDVEIVTKLTPVLFTSNILMHPIVGFIPVSFQPKIDKHEVEATFDLPLERFLGECLFSTINVAGRIVNYPLFYDDVRRKRFVTQGTTASLCMSLAVIIFQKSTQFELFKGSPVTPERPLIFNETQMEYYIKTSKF